MSQIINIDIAIGVAAAIILLALGVPRDLVMRDYLLTSRYYLPELELDRLDWRCANCDGLHEFLPALFIAGHQHLRSEEVKHSTKGWAIPERL